MQQQDEIAYVMSINDANSFNSYDTTQVNILTLQEVPRISSKDLQSKCLIIPLDGSAPFPWQGYSIPLTVYLVSLVLLPHGTWIHHRMVNMPLHWTRRGSQSISYYVRMHCNENRKKVVIIMTKTVTMNDCRKRKMETKTTMRHLDNNKRVKMKKDTCKEDGNKLEHATKDPRVVLLAPAMMVPEETHITSTEMAVINTMTLFGVVITNVAGQHPSDVDYQPNKHGMSDS